ncbi:MAG: hypothetical protein ABIN89_30750 [Chitinophagaceae bacterium]
MAVSISSSTAKEAPNLITAILWTGLVVGTLDATGATIQYLLSGGDNPAKIFRYIASSAFGKEGAAANPSSMVYWGLLFHYIIAFAFTITYFLLAPRVTWLLQHKVAAGIIYGAFIWVVMNLLVVPSSRITLGAFHLKPALIGMGILIVAIGLPLSFITGAYYSRK